jgi:hypothetical protein
MITEDGYLVAEGGYIECFFKRCETMYLVFRCLLDPTLTSALKPNWFKFVSISLQYVFLCRYRCLEGKDLEDWNNASV